MVEDLDDRMPDVLLDRLVFGVDLEMRPTVTLPALVQRLVAEDVGRLAGPVRHGRAVLDIDCPVEGLSFGGTCHVSGRLHLCEDERRLRVLPSTSLEVNGMRLLRSRIDEPPGGGLAGDNFIGPHDAGWTDLFEVQAISIAETLETFVAALADFCGAPEHPVGRLRLRWGEVCRDLEVVDAPRVARQLAASWFGGELRVQQNYLGRCELQGILPTISWGAGTGTSPITKVYAKTVDLLRTEITVRRAEAAAQLVTGARHAAGVDVVPEGEAVLGLLRQLGAAAIPHLDDARGAVEAVEVSPAFAGDLILRLAPLTAVAAPGPRVGRPVSAETQAAARVALESLLLIGRASVRGKRSNTALRRVLDELAGGTNPVLLRQGLRGTLYVLRPEWTEAARRIGGVG